MVAGLTSGCGGSEDARDASPSAEATPPATRPTPAQPPAAACRVGETRTLAGRDNAYAATVLRTAAARRSPGGEMVSRFGRLNVNGVPTVLGVLGVRLDSACEPLWYRVQLPVRPNGATGWVRAADVRLTRVSTRIVVDLSERRVTLYRAGRRVLETVAAIGKPGTPTPTGRFYVNQRLRAPDPTGPFGPGAVGISAFSPTLIDWAQGGPIAIHGTNTPYKLGGAVSYGCVRVANSDLLRLYELATEGTPVVIRN